MGDTVHGTVQSCLTNFLSRGKTLILTIHWKAVEQHVYCSVVCMYASIFPSL